ncbi:MAG: acyl carrier protein [Acidimicrobiia bacterium]
MAEQAADQGDLLADVRSVLVTTLGIEDREATIDASTGLFGTLPELDSMAVVELVMELQDRFGIEIDDDEITGDSFETLGDLVALVDSKRR